jgi:hypothetical protein
MAENYDPLGDAIKLLIGERISQRNSLWKGRFGSFSSGPGLLTMVKKRNRSETVALSLRC